MRIGVDLDGVVAQFARGLWSILNETTGRDVPYTDPVGWADWSPFTENEFDVAFKRARETPGFWLNLKPYHENVIPLRNFLIVEQDWCDVFYVTSRVETASNCSSILAQTNEWLREHVLLRRHTSVAVVTNPQYKPAMMRALGVRMWIDDNLSTVLDGIADGQHAYLLSRPWNGLSEGRPTTAAMRESTVDTLAEFLDRVKDVSRCTQAK